MDKKIQYCNFDFPSLPIESVHLDKKKFKQDLCRNGQANSKHYLELKRSKQS